MASMDDLIRQIKALQDQMAMQQTDLDYRLRVGEAQDAWQFAEEDNVDPSNGLQVDVYIPPNKTQLIQQVILRVKLKAFRSYSAVTASGGSSNPTTSTEPQSIPTTSSVVVSTASVGGGGDTSGASSDETTTNNSTSFSIAPTYLQLFGTDTEPSHTNGGAVAADGAHTHEIADHYHPHSHTLAHTHSTPDHSHTITNNTHEHTVTIAPHDHTVTIASHTHPITAAITLGAVASGCTIHINGTDRTVALTGAATFGTDQDELDVTQYMEAIGYNDIEIRSATLGRIRCTPFVNLYLNNR